MPKVSESTRLARELGKEGRDAIARGKRKQEPPFMHESFTDSEYRRKLLGMSRPEQEDELQRLTPEERRRLFPPDMKG